MADLKGVATGPGLSVGMGALKGGVIDPWLRGGANISPSMSGAGLNVAPGGAMPAPGSLGGIDWSGAGTGALSAAGGAIPGIIKMLAENPKAGPDEQLAWNVGTAAAAPAAAVGTGAALGALGVGAGGASGGAGAAAGAAGAAGGAAVGLPGVVMAIVMAIDSWQKQKEAQRALSKLKGYEATQPEVAAQQQQAAHQITQQLLPGIDPQTASALANTALEQWNTNKITQGQFLSGSGAGGGGAFGNMPNFPTGPFGGPAVFNTQAENEILQDYLKSADIAGKGGAQVQTPWSPTELASTYRPDFYSQYHNYDVLKNVLAGQGWGEPLPSPDNPYYDLAKAYKDSNYDLDTLAESDAARRFGVTRGTNISSILTQTGPQQFTGQPFASYYGWDPSVLSQVQGLQPGNYEAGLRGLGQPITPPDQGPVQSTVAPEVAPSGEAGKAVGRLQPRNVLTGTPSLPRPESDARTEAVFGMRRPLAATPTDQGGQPAPPPTPGTDQARPPAFGTQPTGGGFSVAPGGNIGTGGLVVANPFGFQPGQGNRSIAQ